MRILLALTVTTNFSTLLFTQRFFSSARGGAVSALPSSLAIGSTRRCMLHAAMWPFRLQHGVTTCFGAHLSEANAITGCTAVHIRRLCSQLYSQVGAGIVHRHWACSAIHLPRTPPRHSLSSSVELICYAMDWARAAPFDVCRGFPPLNGAPFAWAAAAHRLATRWRYSATGAALQYGGGFRIVLGASVFPGARVLSYTALAEE